MLFNSYIFLLLFLPLVLFGWFATSRWVNVRLALLVSASYFFYGWNRWEFTLLLAASSLIDYFVGSRLSCCVVPSYRKAWLAVSLISNLGLLGYFKYCGFLAESWNSLVQFLHTGGAIHVPNILLPVGISFYTFQTLSYTIDIYRGQVKPAKSILHFAAYVSMFPQLVAGPIVRYDDVEEQLNSLAQRIEWQAIANGVWFFVIGMTQKILLADSLASSIQPLLNEPDKLQFISGWFALLGYSGQLYFDFAGYSNMAIGLGFFLGFSFPANFNSPYKAVSIQDFWRRWHITLSTFLRDYLYIPLGGNRVNKVLSIRNVMIVMLLGGLWHGAGWTFVLWGAYHGLLLAMYAIYRDKKRWSMTKPVAIAITFFFVVVGWLLFRSQDLAMAGQWYSAIFGMHGFEANFAVGRIPMSSWVVLAIAFSVCWFLPNADEFQPKQTFANIDRYGCFVIRLCLAI